MCKFLDYSYKDMTVHKPIVTRIKCQIRKVVAGSGNV